MLYFPETLSVVLTLSKLKSSESAALKILQASFSFDGFSIPNLNIQCEDGLLSTLNILWEKRMYSRRSQMIRNNKKKPFKGIPWWSSG